MGLRVFLAATLLIAGGPVLAQEWELQQNIPNPFCNQPSDTGPWTEIRMIVSATCRGVLEVMAPGDSEVLATLIDGSLLAGYHTAFWDGTEGSGGADLPNGDYLYRFRATDLDDGSLLFEDQKIATIFCEVTPVQPSTWGQIKQVYRR